MRHKKKVKKLGRTASHRQAVLANLATALIERERIQTTESLAKGSQRLVERLISKAKDGTLHARRQVLKVIKDKKVVAKLFDRIAPRYSDRNGGCVRIIKVGNRAGDGAALSIVELIGSELAIEEPKKKKKRQKKKTEETQPLAPSSEGGDIEDAAEAEVEREKEKTSPEEAASESVGATPEEGSETGSEPTVPEKEGGKTEGRG